MTQRQYGTLKHIFDHGKLVLEDLRKLHAGTLRSMFQRQWIYAFTAHGQTWLALTAAGVDALENFRTAGASLRSHEAELTACTLRLLNVARMRRERGFGARKAG